MSGLELVSDKGLRVDGRRSNELRKIECRLGVLPQTDGSAYIEQGLTKVIASVYGPHEIRGGRGKALGDQVYLNCQISTATFSTGQRKARPRGDRKSQEMSLHLKQVVQAGMKTELYPRSQIDIFVEIIQADGGNFCACVNAVTLALIDAGIPLRDYICACSASLVKDDTTLVDISHVEATLGGPELILVVLPRTEQLVLAEMTQRFHVNHLSCVMDTAIQGCKDIHSVMVRAVRRHISRGASQLQLE